MPVRFFGQFLLEKGAITAQALVAAVRHQEGKNLRIGQLALAAGLLTPEQLEHALSVQKQLNLRTGEAAVRLGFLTEEQVERLLRAQKNSHVLLGDALVEIGALTREALESFIAEFRHEQEAFRVDLEVPREMDPSGICAPLADLTLKYFQRLAFVRAKVAGISREPFTSGSPSADLAHLEFVGDHGGRVVLEGVRSLSTALASSFAGRVVQVESAGGAEAVKAFLGLVAGALSTLLARTGRRFDYASPGTSSLPVLQDATVIRLTTTAGDGWIVVQVTSP